MERSVSRDRRGAHLTYIVSGELLVAAIEAGAFWLLARPIRLLTAVAASFVANGASFLFGMALGA